MAVSFRALALFVAATNLSCAAARGPFVPARAVPERVVGGLEFSEGPGQPSPPGK